MTTCNENNKIDKNAFLNCDILPGINSRLLGNGMTGIVRSTGLATIVVLRSLLQRSMSRPHDY